MITRKRAWLAGRSLRLWWGLAVALVSALTLFAVACGDGDDGDQAKAEVEAAVRAVADAWNGKDVDAFLAAVTDKFLQDEFETSREQAEQELPEDIGEPPITLGEFSNTEVSGGTAATEADFFFAKGGGHNRFSLIREDDVWKLDETQPIAGEIPDGVTAVDLALTEYKFNFDEAAITDGNIAFNVSNIGGEQHVVDLAKIPEDLDIEQALQSEEEPPGIEPIGYIDPIDPGGETTMVFTEALEPGRYAMICWVEAADGEPHFAKGMWAEFTVE